MNIRIRLQRALMTWEPLSGTRLFDQSHSTWNVSAESLLTQQVDNPRTLKGIPWSTFQMSDVKPHPATLVPVDSVYELRITVISNIPCKSLQVRGIFVPHYRWFVSPIPSHVERTTTYDASMLSTSDIWKTRTFACCLRGSSDGWCLSRPYSSIRRNRSENNY